MSTAVSSISAGVPIQGTASVSSSASSSLNQQDFLELLVAQMQYQNPLNPQSNTDMAAQLAQFTALAQSSASSSSLAMLQANSLIGSTVSIQIDSNHSASGTVTGVTMVSGSPQVVVHTDSATTSGNYNLNQVTSVTPPAAATSTTNPTP